MDPHAPTVTFVVPCYNLAHYLRDCVESILQQDYSDFEILIMDDCSPDDTPAVVATLTDPRIRYVRNVKNLRHLQNYNHGIGLARGRYLWLLSADDRLRTRTALGRLVALLDADPNMSFAFSPGVTLWQDGVEGPVTGDRGPSRRVYTSSEFFRDAINGNNVCTPGALARTECYHRVGFFPLDLPYAGEWYLWLRFALFGSVGYEPDAGVHYRKHTASSSAVYLASDAQVIVRDEVQVRWRVRKELQAAGPSPLLDVCDRAIASDYALRTFSYETKESPVGLSAGDTCASIATEAPGDVVRVAVTSRYYELLADLFHESGKVSCARHYYWLAWRNSRGGGSAQLAKYVLSCLGPASVAMRWAIGLLRTAATRAPQPTVQGSV